MKENTDIIATELALRGALLDKTYMSGQLTELGS
jgi:hypothetical protein